MSRADETPRHTTPIPYVHGRHLVPIRRQPTRFTNPVHQALFAEEDEIRARIGEVDRLLVDLATERKRLLDRIRRVHERLRPSYDVARGRRRRAISHEEPLPPTADKPQWLSGRALRSICLAFLGLADGPLTLRELHVLLHRAGYAIRHHHAVKALADALGHEATVGRAHRVSRGVYARAGVVPVDDTSTLPDW